MLLTATTFQLIAAKDIESISPYTSYQRLNTYTLKNTPIPKCLIVHIYAEKPDSLWLNSAHCTIDPLPRSKTNL